MANSKHLDEFNNKIKNNIDNSGKIPLSDDPRIQHILERSKNDVSPDRYFMLLARLLRKDSNPEVLEAMGTVIYNMWASQVHPED